MTLKLNIKNQIFVIFYQIKLNQKSVCGISCWSKIYFLLAVLHCLFVCLFVCNRWDNYYSITAGSRQGSLANPLSLLFLTPRPALSSHQHRILVCLFWSWNLHHSEQSAPPNPIAACQECFELLDVLHSKLKFEW